MNMLSSLKAMLFSSAAPGVTSVQPAAPGDMADFAALLNGTLAEESAVTPAAPQTDVPAASAAMPELPIVEGPDADVATEDLPLAISLPKAQFAHDHVAHGFAIAVAVGKFLPSQLPPGEELGLVSRPADASVEERELVAPALPTQQPEAALPDDAFAPEEANAPGDAPVQLEASLPDPIAPPIDATKARTTDDTGTAQPNPIAPAGEEVAPAETKAPPKEKPKAKAERAEQDPAPSAPVPQPLMTAAIAPSDSAEPAKHAPEESAPPVTAAPDIASVKTMPVPPASPADPAPVQSAPEKGILGKPVAPDDSKRPSAVADASLKVTEQPETPAPALSLPETPLPTGKPVKAEALALLQMVREQMAARQTGVPAQGGEPLSQIARAKADAPVRAAEPTFDPSIASPSPDAVAPVPPAGAPQTGSPAVPSIAPAAPSPDLSASLGAQVVDMGVSGQWIDGLARDIAGLSANGAQGRFQIDTQHLGAVQVNIRHDTDGAAVSLTVASEAAEMALRQDSDRLKLDAGLAAVRIAEVKVERAPAVAETHRAETNGQSSSQQQQQSQQGSQASPWAQNSGQNMGQPQGQHNRWQGRENSGFGPKGSGDPAVLNHADAPPAAHDRARARYA